MTTPLDEKGLEAANVAYERYGQTGDLMAQRLSPGCMEAIIRAYLASSPIQADGLEVVAWLLEHPKDERYPFGERDVTFETLMEGDLADGWAQEPLVTLSQAQAALAAMQGERDSWLSACMEAREGCNQRSAALASMHKSRDEIVSAIGSVRWMDPPDGGNVTLAEQVRRMRADLEAAESEVKRLTEEKEGLEAPETGLGQTFGSAAVGHLREMYPDAFKAIGASARRSLRNFINNRADRGERELTTAEARVKALEEALRKSDEAICDWLNTYAPDMCDPARVKEAEARIGAQGTIAYIADALQVIRQTLPARAALSQGEPE